MDHREIAGTRARALDPRHSGSLSSRLLEKEIGGVNRFTGRRKSREKLERQTQALRAASEFVAVRAVPRHDGIEPAQLLDKRSWRIEARQPHQFETRRSNRSDLIGKTNQRDDVRRDPNFGVGGLQVFERRQGKNAVSDTARSNQKASQWKLLYALAGFKQGAVHILDAQMNRFGSFEILVRDIEAGRNHAIHHAVRRNRILDR